MELDALPVLLLGTMDVGLSAALPWLAMSMFMHSNIASSACLLAAAIALS